jgi:archaellin
MKGNIFNTKILALFSAIVSVNAIIAPTPVKAFTASNKTNLNESWSFALPNYKIQHQGNAVIDLKVNYDYKDGIGKNNPLEYPEFTQISNYINNFLVNYPNETDFWEILNKNLVTELLTKPIPTTFGINYNLANVVDSLTVGIDVKPGSSNINIPRSSIVTGIPKPKFDLNESWSFDFMNYAIKHQGDAVIDLKVSYDYIDGIGRKDPLEYPEFTQIYNYIDKFLVNYPNETDFWEIVNKNLVNDLLTKPIPTTFGFDYNLAKVVDSLTVEIDVKPGSSGIPIARSSKVTGLPRPQPATIPPVASTSIPEPSFVLALGVIALAGLMRKHIRVRM